MNQDLSILQLVLGASWVVQMVMLLLLVVATALHQVWASAFDASGGLAAAGWLAGRVLLATLTTAPLGVVVLLITQLFTGRRGYGNASGSSTA